MSGGLGQGKGNNAGQTVVYSEREQITGITKVVFMIYGGLQTVCLLLLSWKVYDPEMWLPLPHWSTFFALVIACALTWFIQVARLHVMPKK